MGCRCQERRQHIADATRAAAAGDFLRATRIVGYAGATIRQDLADLHRQMRFGHEARRLFPDR